STWILGGIENTKDKNIFLIIIPSRKSEILKDIFKTKIQNETLIITGDYPSYSKAVTEFVSQLIIVNHSYRFKNID
ncbi:hypothetical protein H311_02693, partial [Anncaliia algerae PRA109]